MPIIKATIITGPQAYICMCANTILIFLMTIVPARLDQILLYGIHLYSSVCAHVHVRGLNDIISMAMVTPCIILGMDINFIVLANMQNSYNVHS